MLGSSPLDIFKYIALLLDDYWAQQEKTKVLGMVTLSIFPYNAQVPGKAVVSRAAATGLGLASLRKYTTDRDLLYSLA